MLLEYYKSIMAFLNFKTSRLEAKRDGVAMEGLVHRVWVKKVILTIKI